MVTPELLPWPTFRHDRRNSGRSPLPARYHGDHPWHFQTGKGIFASPVIDDEGMIYVGSADHSFYALRPDGSLAWRFLTGEIIDSAAALPPTDPAIGPTILVPSGDGFLYCLRRGEAGAEREVWKFDARLAPRASYNNWFEANIALGPDGAIYAGNTNFNYYALTSDGRLQWTYKTSANNWSQAAIADDGTVFWGSNDTKVRAVGPDGREKWRRRTWGFIAASAALGSDDTLYIGSFDSNLYALDSRTGRVHWKFKTHDHIYASAALGEDANGRTTAIYFGSTDGIFYALSPQGDLLWSFDTGAPIRSSPVIGPALTDETGDIVYFGCGDGRVYALNADDGSRRWSYDTTPADPILCDRNDLNGSPALGPTGLYIGGEHGQIWYIPYDYPLHVADPRGSVLPSTDLPVRAAGLYYVTPGGNLTLGDPPPLPAASILTLRLVVRKQGRSFPARLLRRSLRITSSPPFPLHWELAADGRHLHLFPDGFLTPGATYTLHLQGNYTFGGLRLGNLKLGGRKAGAFAHDFTFTVAPAANTWPLRLGPDQVDALSWTRLAVPIPTMLPSLNQIGFDYLHWILGVVAQTPPDAQGEGKSVLWAIGARYDENDQLVADPASDFALPLSGPYRGDAFILSNRRFQMAITGIPIPFNLLQLRGQIDAHLNVRPGATGFADARVLAIPTFGPLLVLAGLASNGWRKLLAMCTYLAGPYDRVGGANVRPPGIHLADFTFTPPSPRQQGRLSARFALDPGHTYPLARHRPGLLLLDPHRIEPVFLDYHRLLASETDPAGNLAAVHLTLPAGTTLPSPLQAIVLLDVFPLQTLELPDR